MCNGTRLRLERYPPSAELEQQASDELAKKWLKLRKWVGWIIHLSVLVYFRWHTYQDYLKYKTFLAVPADIAVSGSKPLEAEIFPSANETSLYKSSLSPSYHPDMTKILLKKTQNCKLFTHPFLAIPCIIMVKSNRSLLKISAYPSVR